MAAHMTHEHCADYLGPTSHMIPYHYVVEGKLRVRVGARYRSSLRRARSCCFHATIYTHGERSRLNARNWRARSSCSLNGGLGSIRLGGGGRRAQVICGFLACEGVEDNPVLSTLPRVLHLKVEEAGAAEWIRSTFQYAAHEVAAGRPGSETVLAKLSELLFVEAVRRYVDLLPSEQTGWLPGLRDPHVARSSALFHSDIARAGPSTNWDAKSDCPAHR